MDTRKVFPAGHLQVGDAKRWILLHPQPIIKDSWQDDNTFRFVVVNPVIQGQADGLNIFPPAYHVVLHGDWFIEYDVTTPILVQFTEDEVNALLTVADYE